MLSAAPSCEQRLATELYEEIVSLLSPPDLASFALASRLLYDIGSRLLYRRVTFGHRTQPTKVLLFLASLASNPSLATLVRHLEVDWVVRSHNPHSTAARKLRGEMVDAFSLALGNLTCLETFTMSKALHESTSIFDSPKLCLPMLRELHLYANGIELDDGLVSFIRQHSATLQQLTLFPLTINPGGLMQEFLAMPQLVTLRVAHIDALLAMLDVPHGWPAVTSVHASPSCDVYTPGSTSPAGFRFNLNSLSPGLNSAPSSTVWPGVPSLASIHRLDFVARGEDSLLRIATLQHVLPNIQQLNFLRPVIISGMPVERQSYDVEDPEEPLLPPILQPLADKHRPWPAISRLGLVYCMGDGRSLIPAFRHTLAISAHLFPELEVLDILCDCLHVTPGDTHFATQCSGTISGKLWRFASRRLPKLRLMTFAGMAYTKSAVVCDRGIVEKWCELSAVPLERLHGAPDVPTTLLA